MCPDEEIEQTEVAEANKKIVESEQAVVIFFFVKKRLSFLKQSLKFSVSKETGVKGNFLILFF